MKDTIIHVGKHSFKYIVLFTYFEKAFRNKNVNAKYSYCSFVHFFGKTGADAQIEWRL